MAPFLLKLCEMNFYDRPLVKFRRRAVSQSLFREWAYSNSPIHDNRSVRLRTRTVSFAEISLVPNQGLKASLELKGVPQVTDLESC